jgi:hypothetical protein
MSSRYSPLILAALAVLSTACDSNYIYAGYSVYKNFPLDGSVRTWQYNSVDDSVDWRLLVEKAGTTTSGTQEVVTLRHTNQSDKSLIGEVDWSSDSSEGILIHRTYEEASAVTTTFDPPILVSKPQGVPGDSRVTETGGFTFTCTFEDIDGCATYWAPDWSGEDCFLFTIDDGDGDTSTNGLIVGTYWLVPSWGTALMDLDGYDAQWSLSAGEWDE